MAPPGPQGAVVHLPGVFQRLGAGGVAQVVGELGPLGAGDQVDHRVVIRQHAGLGAPVEARQHLGKFLVGDIGLVVHQRPVVDDQYIVLVHYPGGVQGQLLLVDLVGNHEILEGQHAHAVAERPYAEAGDQLGGGFGDGDDPPAVLLLEFVEYAADQRGLARGGSAGEDDLRNALGHGDASFFIRTANFQMLRRS